MKSIVTLNQELGTRVATYYGASACSIIASNLGHLISKGSKYIVSNKG